jgi:diguanylate cyclase (GGDEF)-like protein
MAPAQGKIRLGFTIGAASLVALFGMIVMFADSESTRQSRKTEALLYQLQTNARGLNANEWEAIANLKIDPDLQASADHFRFEILSELEALRALQGRRGLTNRVEPAASLYLKAIQEEFSLVSKGQSDNARELDDSRVDPDFDALEQTIHDAIANFEIEAQRNSRTTLLSSLGALLGCLGSFLFLALRFERGRVLAKSNERLQQLVTQLSQSQEKLNTALGEVEGQVQSGKKLTELVDILQSCQTLEEAFSIAESVLPATISCRSGALCITSASRNIVEAVSVWGGEVGTEKAFGPDDCWALRRGKAQRVTNSASPLRCAHVTGLPANGYLCIPLAAQGETLGVLYLECAPASSAATVDPITNLERQATAVGERLSLALANLRLREALRRHSIRDPLTGLFNRRFMEESLEREMGRATRGKQPVALVMMDIDHFKRFNDTFGHQAGDAVLRALGDFLKQRTRGQDAACRYGGEEFAFILSGASLEAARKRAEILREELKLLQVQHAGQLLERITLSIGISGAPEHASDAAALIKAADEALYRAKKDGRDRIVMASPLGLSPTVAK